MSEATKKMAAAISNLLQRNAGMLETKIDRTGAKPEITVCRDDVLDMCKNIAANLAEMTVEHSRDLADAVATQERTMMADRIDTAATQLLHSPADELGRKLNEVGAAVLRTMADNIRKMRDAVIWRSSSPGDKIRRADYIEMRTKLETATKALEEIAECAAGGMPIPEHAEIVNDVAKLARDTIRAITA